MRNKLMITAAVLASVITYGTYDYTLDTAFHANEIECLTQNIYHEARGETVQGQLAVANVTMNRVGHEYFPDTVCEVVWQDDQFSWTNDGRSDRMRDMEAYQIARNIAEWVYTGREEDNTDGALFYHAEYVNPSWSRVMEVAAVIDTHIFYQWNGRW